MTRAVKESAAVRAGALIAGAAGLAPPLLAGRWHGPWGRCGRATSSSRTSPAPSRRSTSPARGCAALPAVPLNPANQRLSVGVLSYDGAVYFGLLADAGLAAGADVDAAALDAALAARRPWLTPGVQTGLDTGSDRCP